MTPLAAYLLLFVAVGIGFIFVHLMAGKFIRPNNPDAAKGTTYECGEPTIGSAWIQFDLRFYVVALLFVIFDVEVAFFFPWAVVFGKANALAAIGQPTDAEGYHQMGERAWELLPPAARPERALQQAHLLEVKPEDLTHLQDLRAKRQGGGKLTLQESTEMDRMEAPERIAAETHSRARMLSWMALLEIAVFFGVLLVGFAYLWRRGDLAWVRSLAAERTSGDPAA
jgi:NADH-quinone oxidoreductase subunit A